MDLSIQHALNRIEADSSYHVIEYVEPMRTIVVVRALCYGSGSYEGELSRSQRCYVIEMTVRTEDFDNVSLGLLCSVCVDTNRQALLPGRHNFDADFFW